MRFLADCMLGKLAKWLRMLGYDTAYIQDADDDELVRLAVREDRLLLTRDHRLCERRMVRSRCVFVDWGTTAGQVRQVVRTLGLKVSEESLFTRCTVCNSEITPLLKSEVAGRVPPYVLEAQQEFGYCEQCDKIYWRGTHVHNVLKALEAAEDRMESKMLEAIANRRSVRFYKQDSVSDEDIALVLKAGFCAPSAHGQSPWHAVVVKDQAARDTLAGIHDWTKIIARVGVVIVVCVDRSGFDHFWVEDGSAFMENMLIQAASMGLGTCWVGIHGLNKDGQDAEAIIRKLLGLPDHFGVVGITPLGYASRYPGPHEPKLPEGRVHYGHFGRSEE